MPRRHRSHSMELKRQVVAEYNAGETLHGLSKRHDVCRNLIRIWIAKAEAGEFDDEVAAAELLVRYEARIAALERLVGKQALELSFVKAIRLGQARFGLHSLLSLMRAFARSRSFLMTATMASFGGFPTLMSWSYFALRSGLNLHATRAGM